MQISCVLWSFVIEINCICTKKNGIYLWNWSDENAIFSDNLLLVGGCKSTEFGCCPDGITAAEGPNYLNCPAKDSIPRGACLETEFGCCHDGVTAAQGPFNFGCPDFTCAVSILCKGDSFYARKVININTNCATIVANADKMFWEPVHIDRKRTRKQKH